MKNVKSIQTLTPEQWKIAADDLSIATTRVKGALEDFVKHYPGYIETPLDPDIFESNMRAAIAAMLYVAAFCADKCKFAIVEHIEDAESMNAQELREALKSSENRT